MSFMRTAKAIVTYNGEVLSTDPANRTGSFTYNDPESGSSDDCNLTIFDPYDQWIGAKFPKTGDKLTAQILVNDWRFPGDSRTLDCGIFTVDDPSFSGPPTQVNFKATSQPADTDFTSRKRTQTWENVTVQNMASEIAGRYTLVLIYEASDVNINSLEQSGVPDSDFLKTTCDKYGLSLKIYSNRLVIFDRELYKKKPPVAVIDKSQMTSWSFRDTLAGTYTGGTMQYTDSDSGKTLESKVGTDKRLLSVNGKADSEADAEKQIKAAVNKANDDMTTLSVRIPGDPDRCSSQVIMITGLGTANGLYYTTMVAHSIGGKYETSLDLSKIHPSI